MKSYLIYGVALGLAWIFVKGSFEVSVAITGFLVGFPIAYAFRSLYSEQISVRPANIYYALLFVFSFFKDLFLSNLDVAYRILHPSNPISPERLKYETELNDSGVAVLSNSITLTPGTLVVDFKEEKNELEIHCLNLKDRENTAKEIKKWENLLLKVFGGRDDL